MDLAREAVFLCHGCGASAELGRCQDVAGLVDERTGKVLRLREDDALVQSGLCMRRSAAPPGASSVTFSHAAVLAVGAVGVRIVVGDDGAFDSGASRVDGRKICCDGKQERERPDAAWFGKTYRGAGRLAQLGRCRLGDPDNEQARRFQTRRLVQQQRLAAPGGELAVR